ncbi:MAG TPA: alpha/beta hydrolase [Aggregatilineales bacterium]|nr:alpha/beta hydrolase [Anaerolineales bacterium]HRE49213.1 alpha/beta hydrolase [Aggregatilineales bacterium]
MFRTIRIVVLVAVLALSLTFFLSENAPIHAQPSLPLEACTLKFGIGEAARDADAQCGTFSAPEDWENAAGKHITLKIVVIPAKREGSNAPPIFHLEGGPGAGAIKQFQETWFAAYERLNQDHAIVLIDQRGTGGSTSIDCKEISDQALADLEKATTPDIDITTNRERLAACLERVSAIMDPAKVTSAALADDTNAVRAALGYEKIFLYGSSYGTWLAQVYLSRHPETVAGAVLEGVVAPSDKPWITVANYRDTALQKVFTLCQADAACNDIFPDLPAKMDKALSRFAGEPIRTSGTSSYTGKSYPITMTKERFLESLIAMINQGPILGYIPQVITQAGSGIYTLPASILIASAETELSYGMYFSIVCAETVAFLTPAEIAEGKQNAFYGTSDGVIDLLVQSCQTWRSAELEPIPALETDIPILMFSGAFDSQTPPQFAENAAKRLTNSQLISFPYQGHGVLPFSKCAQNLTAVFLANPSEVKTLDTSCAGRDVKPIFNGAYLVKFTELADPISGRRYTLPEGWRYRQAETPTSPFAYFISQDDLQSIGFARVEGAVTTERLPEFEALIGTEYNATLTLQASLNSFGVTIAQYAFSTAEEGFTGALVIIGGGLTGSSTTSLLWYAAPNNTFTATFEPILTNVLFSLMSP